MLTARVNTPQSQAELKDELAAWGLTTDQAPNEEPEVFEVWDEHKDALLWWCNGGAQLRFIPGGDGKSLRCQGLDVVALEADARLGGRTVKPDDYERIKLIAREVTEHLNSQY